MFRRLFGRKANPPADELEPGPQLGMLALKSLAGLEPARIRREWARLFPELPPLEPGESEQRDDLAVVDYRAGDRTLMLMTADAPIPQGDIDAACKVSWMWKNAAAELRAQTAHVIAVTVPQGEPVAEALDVSRLLAAAAAAGNPAGVYWGNGGQAHKPAMFIDAVQTMAHDDTLPVMLSVGLRISGPSAKGPFTLTTEGMRPFGHRELEVVDTTMGIGDLRLTAYDLINYLLVHGPVIKHGHTFGDSSQRFRVEFTTSRFRDGEPVMRLHIP